MQLLRSILFAGFAAQALGSDPLTPDKAEADVTERALRDVLWNLNKIGRDNGGNRAFGLPGYNASLDFVLERAVTRFGKHIDTYVQKFTHLFEQTRRIAITGPDGESVYTVAFSYNTATPLPDGITGDLVAMPEDDTRGSGCFADQWAGVDVKDKIPLLKRGQCSIADKLKLAKTNGALAVLLYNNSPGEAITRASIGADAQGKIVPIAVTTLEIGTAWRKRLAAGEELSVNILVDSIVENRDSWNIISETKEGDPNNVVMLGAHLDSVQAGPGVNDDGSGTAALLTIMESFKKYKGFKNKVRFAWWGAEESGLIGSLHYGRTLTPEQADKIKFYFNYDMIGSPNPYFAVYATIDAHKYGGKHLLSYLTANGQNATYRPFGSSSDYVAFLELGIPSSGLFTGAGAPWDPNYHSAKDDINNIDWKAIVVNAKAAARAAAELALSLDGVPPRQKVTANPRSKRAIARSFAQWNKVSLVAEKTHRCGGGGDLME